MVAVSKILSIGVIIISFVIGFIALINFGELSKEQRKNYLEEMVSQLINLIIFILVGKIILNFPVFVRDPLSILAYPSDSDTLFLAVLFSAVLFVYKASRWQLDTLIFLESLVLVLLTASFTNEFIQYIWNNNQFAFGHLVLLAVLLFVFIFIRNRFTRGTFILIIMTLWILGVLVLLIVQPFVTMFGYLVKPWYLGIFFLIGVSYILYFKRKRRL